MKILRVNMGQLKVTYEDLPKEWMIIGGRGLIVRIMNEEVRPEVDPLGPQNKLIIAAGPLAGTLAPQLGRISVGAKSPLTLGIKEANSGGLAAQKLDRLGIRAIIIEGIPKENMLYLLKISRDGAGLLPAEEYKGLKNYSLVEKVYKKYNRDSAIICTGIAGERKYKAASVSFTDMFGDPSRNAGRGGLGAVMGSKGIKAIIIDNRGTALVDVADRDLFKKSISSWVDILRRDISCSLFSTFGTPLAVTPNSLQGTMPAKNYRTGRPEGFRKISGDVIKRNVWERGGKFHGCMPGCVVKCSIIYNDVQGKRLASAYEYEAIAMLGSNLDIYNPDAIGRLKFLCDDLGVDLIEVGGSLSVAGGAGRMKMGDEASAIRLLKEIEQGTDFGRILGNGVISTAKALSVTRIPEFKGQAIPGHDPRSVKGIGVTYATSPMGADHTAGLTYRIPLQKAGQIKNSLRSQIQAATCDAFGYCINSLPGGQSSIYVFLSNLLNARYGLNLQADDIVEVGKQTIRDELKFNEGAGFGKTHKRYANFVRDENLQPTNTVFDVEDSEIDSMWEGLSTYKEPKKIWEVRIPSLPSILLGAGVIQRIGQNVKKLNIRKALIITDPGLKRIGIVEEVERLLTKSHIDPVTFTEVVPDPPEEEIERIAQIYTKQGCDGLVALGGGSSMDSAKATSLRVSQPGILAEYGSMVGGAGKIKPPLPPLICIPTTSGTGSEVNPYSIITDNKRDVKFVILSNLLVPKVAIVDPDLCSSMPQELTAQTGIDALAHCIEGYVGMAIPYHPYYEALGLYGVKLIGRSLKKAYIDGKDIDARTDMCTAAMYGGLCFSKGLGLGHAIGHVLGGIYHIPHGRSVAVGMLAFVRGNVKAVKKEFSELAWALDQSGDLEGALVSLYKDLGIPTRLRELGIPEADLGRIAFEASMDVPNIVGNPIPPKRGQILDLLEELY